MSGVQLTLWLTPGAVAMSLIHTGVCLFYHFLSLCEGGGDGLVAVACRSRIRVVTSQGQLERCLSGTVEEGRLLAW